MRKALTSLILAILAVTCYAQKDVTRFLDIPVDGSKSEMIRKLKAKGFKSTAYEKDILEGEFNGTDVNIFIATNGNKVCRIMVCDANSVDERSIQIRFNKLCRQFENNSKYISLDDYTIPDDEDIAYEITVNNKRYQAVYHQKPDGLSTSEEIREKILSTLSTKYTLEQLANPTEEIKQEVLGAYIEFLSKKSVWFMISEAYGKYYISMFYDNEYNRANGDDL